MCSRSPSKGLNWQDCHYFPFDPFLLGVPGFLFVEKYPLLFRFCDPFISVDDSSPVVPETCCAASVPII
eukprot:m.13988 g.13988  ORF g.13988 m.13988 type:complete len:69 (-) comp4961_c0_seq1:1574-1780(-)